MIPFAYDTETALMAPGRMAPPPACLSWASSGDRGLEHWTTCLDVAVPMLEDPEILIIGHNVAYDMTVLLAQWPHLGPLIWSAYEADRVTDTMLRQKLCDVAGGVYRGFVDTESGATVKIGYGLDDLALRLLGRKLEKEDTWRLRYGELIPVPLDQWPLAAREYPVTDATTTLDVFQVQEENREYLDDQFRQARAAFWIQLWTTWGIRTDPRGLDRLVQLTELELGKIKDELIRAGLVRPDRRNRKGELVEGSRDTKMAQARIVRAYQAQGKPFPKTDSGLPSLDKLACKESGDHLLVQYAELTSLRGVMAKDVPALARGVCQPIHTRCESILETGRVSTKDPNTQNVRRLPGIRECFVPREGDVFVSADFSGLELCTLAQVCLDLLGYSTLAEMLNQGLDPHMMMAAEILGRAYEWCKANKELDLVDNARQSGKVANFGFPGGLGLEALTFFAKATYGVDMTVEQAAELKAIWTKTLPEMVDYFRMVDHQVRRSLFPQIKHVRSNRYRGGVGFTEACNSFFQGLGSDVAKAAGWAIARGCYLDTASPLWGFRIVNFVHDEFILEGPEHRAHEAALELSRVMVTEAKVWLPGVRVKAEPLVARRWSNNAKPVWRDGRLIPWDM